MTPDLPEQQPPAPYPPEDAPVYLELQRLENARSTWRGTLGLLAVSLLLFVAALSFTSFGGSKEGEGTGFRDRLWWIIPVLAFHELGHYLAMRWFGYRNVRMFFIPFFGAAVSGKHYNVPGWKKSVVALSGPVPGVFLGLVVGAFAMYYKQVDLQFLSGFLLVLNGLQLLPLLPLDGGWVVHAVVFARHPVLEAIFRVLAAVTLLGFGVFLGDYVLGFLGGIMLLAVPAAWRVAAAANRLRLRGGVPASPDGNTIPPEAVAPILAELRAGSKVAMAPNLQAQQVVGVYEMLNARPPGVFGSLALLAVHFGTLAAAVVVPLLALLILHWGPFADHFDEDEGEPPPVAPPALVYNSDETAAWRGPRAPDVPPDKRVTLVAHFGQAKAAREKFESLQKEVPPDATLRWFGRSVMLTLPDDQRELRQRWKERLQPPAEAVAVDTKEGRAWVRLHCVAPDEATARRIQAELRGYLVNDYLLRTMLLPPWSSAWEELPAEDRERFARARRTLDRLQEISKQASRAPEVRKLRKELTNPFRGRKVEDLDDTLAKIQQAIREENDRLVAAVRAEPDADLETLDAWMVIADTSKITSGDRKVAEAALKEQTQHRRLLAERLGAAILLNGDMPVPGSNLEATIPHGGEEYCRGMHIELRGLAFTQLAEGLPALAGWLCRQGCTGMLYEVSQPGMVEDDEP